MSTPFDMFVKCPFYQSAGGMQITCEGFGNGQIKVVFGTKTEKRSHIDSYCATLKYGKCPIAQIISQKYK